MTRQDNATNAIRQTKDKTGVNRKVRTEKRDQSYSTGTSDEHKGKISAVTLDASHHGKVFNNRQSLDKQIAQLKRNIEHNLLLIGRVAKTRPEKAIVLCELVVKNRKRIADLATIAAERSKKEAEEAKAKPQRPSPFKVHVKTKRHSRWSKK